ncbi:hypothetical protein EVAR_65229_1 [Eumeta japonica]|uniref:Uncharacterized protein n=1 Tax=Eumeta variegata TaxID=151549 RepID=A0A4C1ZBL5_EUMVA|nr:hypothetical protein EVAR_65229_1 [Eumeta japonica]
MRIPHGYSGSEDGQPSYVGLLPTKTPWRPSRGLTPGPRVMAVSESLCEQTDEYMHHVLRSCPLYDDIRSEMLSGIKVLQVGPVHYTDLVGTQANFRRFLRYARAWHGLRGGQE